MTDLPVTIASLAVPVLSGLVVWAIRDVKIAITNNTAEVNALKVEVAKLQAMVTHGDERIKKLENETKEQWRYINKKE